MKYDWVKYFPFKEPRPQQVETINEILKSFLDDNKKFVIAECGTGTGKSGIAVAVSRYLLNETSSSDEEVYEQGSWFLTTQKLLQEQYVKDFGHGLNPMVTIKSANNYICSMHENSPDKITCAEVHRLVAASDLFKQLYKGCCQGECKYRKAKQDFLNSSEGITNYSYFLAETKYAGKIKPRRLLVCDEAHTLQEQLGSFVEISISERFAQQELEIKMPNTDDINEALRWVKGSYMSALQRKIIDMSKLLADLGDAAKKITSFQSYARKYELLDKHKCKINRFFQNFTTSNWVLNVIPAKDGAQRKFEFKPVDVSTFAQDHLYEFADKVLFLSATILDKDVFCRTVGVDKNDVVHIKHPSPFDKKNRPVHYVPVGSMSRKNIETSLPKMASAVKFILENHPKEKGIIHCSNFRIAQYIHENVKSKRILIHDSTNREEVLHQHKTSKQPTVLISPSMSEGVDLADDASRFQIMCKIPFPYIGDKVTQKRMELDQTWYDYQTAKTIVQALGRSIRHENDYAISYILDTDWKYFFKRAGHMFPEEIKNNIE